MGRQCSCGYEAGDFDVVCTKCGSALSGAKSVSATSHALDGTESVSDAGVLERRLRDRYTDAYRVARFFVSTGAVLKWVGGCLAALAALISLSSASGPFIMIGMLGGAALFAMFFVLGVLVAAQGQMLSATLDGTINASPMLTSEQKVRIMFSD